MIERKTMEIHCDTNSIAEVLKALVGTGTPIAIDIDNGRSFSIIGNIGTEEQTYDPHVKSKYVLIGTDYELQQYRKDGWEIDKDYLEQNKELVIGKGLYLLTKRDDSCTEEKVKNDPVTPDDEPIYIGGYDDEVKVCLDRYGTLCKVVKEKGEDILHPQKCSRVMGSCCSNKCIDFCISDDNKTLHTCIRDYNIKLIPVIQE